MPMDNPFSSVSEGVLAWVIFVFFIFILFAVRKNLFKCLATADHYVPRKYTMNK